MDESKEKLKLKLLEWLTNQGYPLEMEVARIFESYDFDVSISDVYSDYESNSDREIDVVARSFSSFKHRPVLRVHWAVECKLSKDKPWILFLSEQVKAQDARKVPYGLITSDEFEGKLLEKYFKGYKSEIDAYNLLNPVRVGHSLTQALTNGQDVTYKAMQSCVKASIDFLIKTDTLNSKSEKTSNNKPLYWGIAFPVIVIQGSLYEYSKDKKHGFKLEETDFGIVEWKGSNPLNVNPYIYIVTIDYLKNFVGAARGLTNLLIEIAQQEP